VDLYYFLQPDFWFSPYLVAAFTLSLFMAVLLRYLLFAWLYWQFLQYVFRQKSILHREHYLREIKWSAFSSLIFAVLTATCYWAYQHGYTKIYTNISDHTVSYFVFSLVLIAFLYDLYYYWLHRWMHRPSVFKIVHRVHHESLHPTIFTSFSFHPLEAILQFFFLPVVIVLIPVHYSAIAILLLLMTISALINHAGVEIFPKRFRLHPLGKWLIGSTHHDLHHQEFNTNFGLYFTLWDRIMKTESKKFNNRFDANVNRRINRSR
jgi:Delta7-sterol 5-desaturase